MISLICGILKKNKLVNKIAKTTTKQTSRYKEHTSSYQWEEGGAIKGYRRKKGFYGNV